MKIAVVTDTDASLPQHICDQYQIRLVPITVQFGEESFESEVDITDEEVFVRIDREGKLPTTAAPSPGKWAQAFQAAFDDGADAVLCFTVSANLSATYDAAVLAATDIMKGSNITVVDTNSLSIAQGFMVVAAAKALQEGAGMEEAVAAAKALDGRMFLFGGLSTLRYLAMSGRVGHIAAGMANLLNIKPILTMENGKLELLEKIRTRKKAWTRMLELSKEKLSGKKIEQLAVLHVACQADAEEFAQMAREYLDYSGEIMISGMTAGLSVHTGAGMVGIAILTD